MKKENWKKRIGAFTMLICLILMMNAIAYAETAEVEEADQIEEIAEVTEVTEVVLKEAVENSNTEETVLSATDGTYRFLMVDSDFSARKGDCACIDLPSNRYHIFKNVCLESDTRKRLYLDIEKLNNDSGSYEAVADLAEAESLVDSISFLSSDQDVVSESDIVFDSVSIFGNKARMAFNISKCQVGLADISVKSSKISGSPVMHLAVEETYESHVSYPNNLKAELNEDGSKLRIEWDNDDAWKNAQAIWLRFRGEGSGSILNYSVFCNSSTGDDGYIVTEAGDKAFLELLRPLGIPGAEDEPLTVEYILTDETGTKDVTVLSKYTKSVTYVNCNTEKIAPVENIIISEDGLVSFDAVPGAIGYSYALFEENAENGSTRFVCSDAIETNAVDLSGYVETDLSYLLKVRTIADQHERVNSDLVCNEWLIKQPENLAVSVYNDGTKLHVEWDNDENCAKASGIYLSFDDGNLNPFGFSCRNKKTEFQVDGDRAGIDLLRPLGIVGGPDEPVQVRALLYRDALEDYDLDNDLPDHFVEYRTQKNQRIEAVSNIEISEEKIAAFDRVEGAVGYVYALCQLNDETGEQASLGSYVITENTIDLSNIIEDGNSYKLRIRAIANQNEKANSEIADSGWLKPGEKKTVPEQVSFTVSFNENGHGAPPASQTVVSGFCVEKPSDPSETGYTFGGWYKEKECINSFDFTAAITEDITLYAKWTKNSTIGGNTSSGGSGGGGSSGGSSGSGGGKAGAPKPTMAVGTATYSKNWYADETGIWKIKNSKGEVVTNAWLCDDAVTANGSNVWYLLKEDGSMLAAGLVQDNTGNFYSLETNHNGFFGMLRYKDGYYDCNGVQVYLEFEQNHNGSFAAVKNSEGIAKLQKIYGITKYSIGNESCVNTKTF